MCNQFVHEDHAIAMGKDQDVIPLEIAPEYRVFKDIDYINKTNFTI